MSALKESSPLVWEELGKDGTPRLRFKKKAYPTHPVILEALKAKPMEGEAFERFLKRVPDKAHQGRPWKYDGSMKLPEHEAAPFVVITPVDWRRVAIQPAGELFDLVSFGSRMQFLAGDKKFYALPTDLALTGLTLQQALANGARLEALIKKNS